MKNSGEEDSNEAKKGRKFNKFEKRLENLSDKDKDLNNDSQKSDSISTKNKEEGNNNEAKLVIRKLNEEIEDIKANRELRDKYSFKAFKVVKKSLWGWAILLFIYGLVKLLTRHENGGFEIFSDHVLIAITTATTLNIFAGFLSLIRGLFPPIKENRKKK